MRDDVETSSISSIRGCVGTGLRIRDWSQEITDGWLSLGAGVGLTEGLIDLGLL